MRQVPRTVRSSSSITYAMYATQRMRRQKVGFILQYSQASHDTLCWSTTDRFQLSNRRPDVSDSLRNHESVSNNSSSDSSSHSFLQKETVLNLGEFHGRGTRCVVVNHRIYPRAARKASQLAHFGEVASTCEISEWRSVPSHNLS
jgi:hypothetical protein